MRTGLAAGADNRLDCAFSPAGTSTLATSPRRQADRRDATRAALVAAARALFATQGFANTHTNDIVVAANVTRGALYHHFTDKLDLFRAVVEAEQADVANTIEQASENESDLILALIDGGRAYLASMADDGRRRILLVDAPAVLGAGVVAASEAAHARRTLTEGVQAAVGTGLFPHMPVEILTDLIDAMFERAAAAPADRHEAYLSAMRTVFEGLRRAPR